MSCLPQKRAGHSPITRESVTSSSIAKRNLSRQTLDEIHHLARLVRFPIVVALRISVVAIGVASGIFDGKPRVFVCFSVFLKGRPDGSTEGSQCSCWLVHIRLQGNSQGSLTATIRLISVHTCTSEGYGRSGAAPI